MNEAQPWGSDAGVVPAGKPPGQRRPLARSVAVAALAAVALGVAVGQVWRLVAPRVPIVKVDQGQYFYGDAQPEQAAAAEGWLGLLGLIAGVLAAVAVWLFLRHRRGVAVLAVLVLGSLAGGFLGWWLAVLLDVARFETLAAAAPVGGRLEAPLSLQVITELNRGDLQPNLTAAVLAQALAAALTYTLLAGFAIDPELRPYPPDEPEEESGPPLAPPSPGLGTSPGLSTSPGLGTSPGLSAAPGLGTSPGLSAAPGLSTSPGLSAAPGLSTSPGPSPGLGRPSGLSSAPGGPADPKGAPESP